MVVEYSERFETELFALYCYIAKDSTRRADTFVAAIKEALEGLKQMPLRHRQSRHSDDPNVRDFIFKGYVIPYRVYDGRIRILGIFNQNLWE